MDTTPTMLPRYGWKPADAAIAAGISRTRIFQAMRAGKLVARKLGRATIIPDAELQRFIQSLPIRNAPAAA